MVNTESRITTGHGILCGNRAHTSLSYLALSFAAFSSKGFFCVEFIARHFSEHSLVNSAICTHTRIVITVLVIYYGWGRGGGGEGQAAVEVCWCAHHSLEEKKKKKKKKRKRKRKKSKNQTKPYIRCLECDGCALHDTYNLLQGTFVL